VAEVLTGTAAHDFSISSQHVFSVSGFLRYATSFRDPPQVKVKGVNQVRVGDTEYYLFMAYDVLVVV
jgi:hypothetical protein